MNDVKQLSADDLAAQDDTRYDEVIVPRGMIKLGSVSSKDILEWIDENDDKVKGKFAGLRLLVKSIINPDGTRIPEGERESYVLRLVQQDNERNGILVDRCLKLNGVRGRGKEPKNGSGETTGEGSPIASPSQPEGSAPTTSSAG